MGPAKGPVLRAARSYSYRRTVFCAVVHPGPHRVFQLGIKTLLISAELGTLLEWPWLLRIVRRRPTCAELSDLAEADGPVLDNPQGRKPRGRADMDQQDRGAMGIWPLAEAAVAKIVGMV